MSSLFIPSKIKVGFQNRKDTYTKRLAYVIYYDAKGVLRKEKSWNSWRDEKIEPEEFENVPTSGFVLNKDVKRYGWHSFSSNRSYIRMYDPRGIEFEISPENLIGILMETTCSKRGLDGEFVYAWDGTELVLLPCASEEYQKAKENTQRQGMVVSAKELKPGCSYTTKKNEEVIYLGRFKWYNRQSYSYGYYAATGLLTELTRKGKKAHIFAHAKNQQYSQIFFDKSDVSFLASLNSEEPVKNYAELMDRFDKSLNSKAITSLKTVPCNLDLSLNSVGNGLVKNTYATRQKDLLYIYEVRSSFSYPDQKLNGYTTYCRGCLDLASSKTRDDLIYGNGHRYGYNEQILSEAEIAKKLQGTVQVFYVLENGKEVELVN